MSQPHAEPAADLGFREGHLSDRTDWALGMLDGPRPRARRRVTKAGLTAPRNRVCWRPRCLRRETQHKGDRRALRFLKVRQMGIRTHVI